jgi:hypothetical protein
MAILYMLGALREPFSAMSSLGGIQKTKNLWLHLLCCSTLLFLFISQASAQELDGTMGGLYNEVPDGLDEVDIIIAGGLFISTLLPVLHQHSLPRRTLCQCLSRVSNPSHAWTWSID